MNNGKDGIVPYFGALIFDGAGNLYGTTVYGGTDNIGTVFQLTPGSNGKWTEKVLHSFNGKDGGIPYAGLVFDAAGNLYGTTFGNTVFQLAPRANGKWTEKVLHIFNGKRGAGPGAGSLIFDAAGNLYGTTEVGGAYTRICGNGCGTAFELSPGANGTWNEKILYRFNRTNGYYPIAGVIMDAAGNLYGTTSSGGAHGQGTVFEITP